MPRTASKTRTTSETTIQLTINLDGTGQHDVSSGVGFFDHMLATFSKHSLIDITLSCTGDTVVDDHHTVEDCGIVLGQCIHDALGDRKGVRRFGFASVPLDEALTQATVDLAGRAHFSMHGEIEKAKVGTFDSELAEDFFQALAVEARMALHIEPVAGRNLHHRLETMFKAVARAMREALEFDPRRDDVPSTKGTLV